MKIFIIYPENELKSYWDIFMTIILIISCITTPLRLAFADEHELEFWIIANAIIDSMFLIDMLLTFFSAHYDENLIIIDNRKEIAKRYL